MAGSTLNREDYKTAIPQLSAQMKEILDNNIVINRTVINLTEGKVSDLNSYLGYFQSLTTGYFQAIAGDIQYLTSREAYINHLKADIAGFGYLTAETADLRYATIQSLTAATARIGDLEADHVSVSDLTAATGRISDLEADHVSVSDLNATNADVSHLKVGDLTIGGVTVNIYDLAMAIKSDAMASGTTWYKVSATTPSAPAGFDPTTEGWSQTEPAYVAGTTNHLYSCLRVVYADDDPQGTRSYQWSDVHLIQSWEAAKSAYTYADDANTAATNAKSAADSAMKGLGQVEDVVGVLEWITSHGTMESQAGTTFDENNVYFIVDPNGDYVIGGTHYSLVTNPVAADIDSYYCLSVDRSIQNYVATHIVVDSEGLWIIPDSGGNKVLIATGGTGKTYETAGTYVIGKVNNVDTVFAKFLKNGATMMAEGGTQIAHLGYGEGQAESGTAEAPYYTLGMRAVATDIWDSTKTYRLGNLVLWGTSLETYVCIRENTGMPPTNNSYWKLCVGNYSYAEGYNVVASGYAAHAEGYNTVAAGNVSHAEGSTTRAMGAEAHAEGLDTKAIGDCAHAEGDLTKAIGNRSHAQNEGTETGYDSQTAIGKYNDNRQNNAFEIGNGTGVNNRSNAFEVDWNGNVLADGDIEDGQGNVLSEKLDSNGIFDLIYPVGSYYWTSDGNFLPADVFGGRWEKIDAGVTLVSAGTGYTVRSGTAKDGGEETHTLDVSEMPAHTHRIDYVYYNRGSGSSQTMGYLSSQQQSNYANTGSTGGGGAHNNMPPYKCAYCWHRTA